MKNFIEEEIGNAKYGVEKKLLLASFLSLKGDHGAFFSGYY